MPDYRVTFRTKDARGIADVVYDVVADALTFAITQASWRLAADHPDDKDSFRAVMAVEIER